jgi:hypothetical protein
VRFHLGNSQDVLEVLSKLNFIVDILMLDSGLDAAMMLYEFCAMRMSMPVGGLVICHDWDSPKTDYLKLVLANDRDFKQVNRAEELVVFERVGNFHPYAE